MHSDGCEIAMLPARLEQLRAAHAELKKQHALDACGSSQEQEEEEEHVWLHSDDPEESEEPLSDASEASLSCSCVIISSSGGDAASSSADSAADDERAAAALADCDGDDVSPRAAALSCTCKSAAAAPALPDIVITAAGLVRAGSSSANSDASGGGVSSNGPPTRRPSAVHRFVCVAKSKGRGKVASLKSRFEELWVAASRQASVRSSQESVERPETPLMDSETPRQPASPCGPNVPGSPACGCSLYHPAVEEAQNICKGKVACTKPRLQAVCAEAARVRTSAEFHADPLDGEVELLPGRVRESAEILESISVPPSPPSPHSPYPAFNSSRRSVELRDLLEEAHAIFNAGAASNRRRRDTAPAMH